MGFSLENFDAVGRWRTQGESFVPIDASGALPDGTTFEGVGGLRRALLGQPELFLTTLTEKLLVYGCSGERQPASAPRLEPNRSRGAGGMHRPPNLVRLVQRHANYLER